MHLINCYTRHLEEFFGEKIPAYAILSHAWGEGEVSYAEMKYDQTASRLKEGYRKIDFTCRQALLDGYQYAWVDTCSIDKSSSAELSEAVNSMFRWYEKSAVCYVYLSDVFRAGFDQEFPQSRWFTRGWTLQELLAPKNVTFYDREWSRLGTKIEFANLLHDITKIDTLALDPGPGEESALRVLSTFCSAQKMSWASHRQTTREEDVAYSLLGIFNIAMPLLYGEGTRAFQRLQEEIIRQSGDDTILAWGLNSQDHRTHYPGTQHTTAPSTAAVMLIIEARIARK
ncbi:HET-domain-containing protein [Phaeosphaeriaceae sp. SRC1lsM3a]|nr:HET-domain-containing protein [Stagonospora sp. SRC1lsM3a]